MASSRSRHLRMLDLEREQDEALRGLRAQLEALAGSDDEVERLAHVESTWVWLMKVVDSGVGGAAGLAAVRRMTGLELAVHGQPMRMRERPKKRARRAGKRTLVPGPMRKMEKPDV